MTPLKLLVFLVVATLLAYVSRRSLRSPRHHGFHRYLAWLAILALLLLNIGHWFEDRYAPRQLLSWLLLAVSLWLVAHGALMLKRHGRPKSTHSDPALFDFEKTTVLVEAGVFRRIRHPLYASLILLAWGISLKNPSWPGALLALAATFFVAMTAIVEEAECLRKFGQPYSDYRKRTRMFIPGLL